ncbi:OLC1v1024278C1 [Oldenlandia corymbosa var. corymbosa]|uniref:OLC1v1024278C1 n=1 Tax=Oldenlandia corymbosa var. corymbosa TaxID=529605 RepID=A0AAV1C2N6_OLDCO|nr:OLC1v1024278C1 [Oldenlandia corymbosa var. corymbosa]
MARPARGKKLVTRDGSKAARVTESEIEEPSGNYLSSELTLKDPARQLLIKGDVNNVLSHEEKQGGLPVSLNEVEGFRMAIDECQLEHLLCQGGFFTWNDRQLGTYRISAKLDRVLINGEWLKRFEEIFVTVLTESISNHCPLLVKWEYHSCRTNRYFKFYNMLTEAVGYKDLVQQSWRMPVKGTKQFQLVQKQQRLKRELKLLNRDRFARVDIQVQAYREEMEHIQAELQVQPNDEQL